MAQDYFAVIAHPEAFKNITNAQTVQIGPGHSIVGDGQTAIAPLKIPGWLSFQPTRGSMFMGMAAGQYNAEIPSDLGFGNTVFGSNACKALADGSIGDNTALGGYAMSLYLGIATAMTVTGPANSTITYNRTTTTWTLKVSGSPVGVYDSTATGFDTYTELAAAIGSLSGWSASVASGFGDVATNTAVSVTDVVVTSPTAIKAGVGGYNTAVGADSQVNGQTGHSNTTVGKLTLYANMYGSENTCMGRNALSAYTGSKSTAIGTDAGRSITSGTFMTSLGYEAAGYHNGDQNIAIGASALRGVSVGSSTGSDNVVVGTSAGYSATTMAQSILIGSNAGVLQTTATGNIAIGYYALGENTTTAGIVAVGQLSCRYVTGTGNTGVGALTLSAASNSATYNTAIGDQSGASITTGSFNTFCGAATGATTTTGGYNTAIGHYALLGNIGGGNNTAIGYYALKDGASSANNVAIGKFACQSATGNQNVAIGVSTLQSGTNSAADNTAIGTTAGFAVTSGSRNTLVGSGVATTLTTGSNNIVIGYLIDLPSASSSNMLDIGNLIYATAINATTGTTVNSTGKVGIREAAPDYVLDVNGDFGFTPGASVTPADNGDVVIEATNNTTLTFKLRGSDGTVRSGTVTLS